MTELTDATLYHHLIDVQGDRPIHVFLGRDPTEDGPGGPLTEPVHLELLSPAERFGRPGRPGIGRPVLGQARGPYARFREFATSEDLWEAGFLPVPHYRICDTWEDYHSPWGLPPATPDQPTDNRCDESL